jgi:hypothetical protein
MSSRLVPTATPFVGYALPGAGEGVERQPLAANINTTLAHDQLARFIVENAFINAANYQPKIEAHIIYRSRPAGSINRNLVMAVQNFWVI